MASGGARTGAGRRRKSPERKALSGTDRKDRELVIGEAPPDGAMVAPAHLSALAKKKFRAIAGLLEEQRRASPHFTEHVALLAIRLAQVQLFQADLTKQGFTYETTTASGGTMIRARPEVAMHSDAMRQAQSLIGELMLNPAASLRIASGQQPGESGFDGF